MDKDEPRILDLLPQQYPFRFIDQVPLYKPGKRMQASFDPAALRTCLGGGAAIPVSVLIEGLAQTAVLLTQLETRPLGPGEMPLLGKVRASIKEQAVWDRLVYYELAPERIWQRQAVFSGSVQDEDGRPLVTATLLVAIADKGSDPK
ncbi:FabA-like domain protein [Xylanibacillus composti]|uniref:3-hydroxyacyl-[acyl-carrier-protein] dehydratase n=1 Tax=Xylanibacillus composti TaxID=1572762 RepID=A0A8J4H4F7_9BACL|nr:FabA-like domain protein [Xylanibacillus composti]MDT9726737.1 FabA-like domain protein [Xylanibacillus composti]GIQ69331.1 hypothetical protein XYCOK13_21550 [Xylanibacillus composti]